MISVYSKLTKKSKLAKKSPVASLVSVNNDHPSADVSVRTAPSDNALPNSAKDKVKAGLTAATSGVTKLKRSGRNGKPESHHHER